MSDEAHRFEQAHRAITLHHQSASAEANDLHEVALVLRAREHDARDAVARAIERAQHIESIEVWHEEIEHEHVGRMLLHQLQRFLSVGRSALYGEVGLGSQQC